MWRVDALRLLDKSKIQFIMKTLIMYIGFISFIIFIAGYVLFLNGWNPVVSVAMMFIGLLSLINMSRKTIQSLPTYQDEG